MDHPLHLPMTAENRGPEPQLNRIRPVREPAHEIRRPATPVPKDLFAQRVTQILCMKIHLVPFRGARGYDLTPTRHVVEGHHVDEVQARGMGVAAVVGVVGEAGFRGVRVD